MNKKDLLNNFMLLFYSHFQIFLKFLYRFLKQR